MTVHGWAWLIEFSSSSPLGLITTLTLEDMRFIINIRWHQTYLALHQRMISILLLVCCRNDQLNIYPFNWSSGWFPTLQHIPKRSCFFLLLFFKKKKNQNSVHIVSKRLCFLPTASPMLSSPSSGFSSSVLLFLVLMVGLRLEPNHDNIIFSLKCFDMLKLLCHIMSDAAVEHSSLKMSQRFTWSQSIIRYRHCIITAQRQVAFLLTLV